MILLLGWLLLAQAHDPPPRDNASQGEQCKDTCRKKHCDGWLACNNIEEAKAREDCKDRLAEDETRCQKVCGESRI